MYPYYFYINSNIVHLFFLELHMDGEYLQETKDIMEV